MNLVPRKYKSFADMPAEINGKDGYIAKLESQLVARAEEIERSLTNPKRPSFIDRVINKIVGFFG